jgi:S-adenosylmethionine hydrolase
VAEVDPGIGARERSIVLETDDGKLFVGPDNGLFTGVMDELGIASVREITNPNLTRQGRTSAIFNGRDIYGPVAGHLAAGTDLSEVGPEIFDPVRIELAEADLQNGTLIGTIVHVDHWGHHITNIPQGLIEMEGLVPGDRVEIVVGGETKEALFGTTYNDVPPGEWVVMTGLSGQLVISKNMYSAADTLGVSAGAEVRVHEIWESSE